MEKGKIIGIIFGIIAILIVGAVVGYYVRKPTFQQEIYSGESASFVVSNINIFAWTELAGVCYSKFGENSQEFKAHDKVCLVSRTGSSVNSALSYNVACKCYGTNVPLKRS